MVVTIDELASVSVIVDPATATVAFIALALLRCLQDPVDDGAVTRSAGDHAVVAVVLGRIAGRTVE